MPRFLEQEEATPCPQRVTRSSTSSNNNPPQITSFPLAAVSSDNDSDDDLDYTRAITSTDYQLTIGQPTRKKGLKEPPRRITHYVPPTKPQKQEQAEQPPPAKQEPKKEPLPNQATTITHDARPQGLQQHPRRSMMPGRPMRPRISAMLKARHSNDEPPVLDEVAVQANERARSARNSEENAKRRPALGEKPQPPPNVQEVPVKMVTAGEKKQLQAPPKRPLQPAVKVLQQTGQGNGVKEKNWGKENVPPGGEYAGGRKRGNVPEKTHKSPTRKSARLSGRFEVSSGEPARKPSEPVRNAGRPVHRKLSAEKARKRSSETLEDDDSFVSTCSTSTEARQLRLIKRQKMSMDSLPSPPSFTAEEEAELLPPEDFLLPGAISKAPIRRSGPRPLDPVLSENLERCEMYEQSWLEAQESSVTQLLNHLLAQYSPAPVGKPRLTLRKEFLAIYRAAPFPLIYNRVHASLLYGALSITQSVIERSSASRLTRKVSNGSAALGWGTDVGMREKFLDLLMGCYEQSALITALEVVIGRDMFALAESGEAEKKTLERYIERYLIKSEDLLSAAATEPENSRGKVARAGGEDDDKGSPAWLLRRTLLRSFMLILLLDKVKARGVLGRQCLFKKASTNKSSSSILNALAKLLLPSMGNIPKSLSHLNYSLETTQPPLSEYDYTVHNIAVDIRDGVRLARLVEVILHSKRRDSFSSESEGDEEEDWALTPHLQYPTTSRPQKLHNVTLVLNALKAAHGNLSTIDAKDIVDGHRENTVGLLWSLLGQKGLELLVDWDVVQIEIQKLERHARRDSVGRYRGKTDHVSLLKNWASGVAAKHGLEVENLTTSFADGRVFSAIVSEYEQYLPSLAKQEKDAPLEAKLKAIGCNSYFAGLFNSLSQSGRVFSQDFVVSGLAYLCSRLLQPSAPERAAMVIQRAYRQCVFRTNLERRIKLLMMAHDCAEVINTRNKVLDAAVTIQRAYRAYLHVKIQILVDSMTGIQAISRGFLARRKLDDSRWAAVLVQRRWRDIREKRFQERMGIAVQGVIGVQTLARGMIVRQKQMAAEAAVLKIQAWWRHTIVGRHQRVKYLQMCNAASLIQKNFRKFNESKDSRLHFVLAVESIRYLQASARGFLVRQRHTAQVNAATKILRWVRNTTAMRAERSIYVALQNAALVIQRQFRSITLARKTRNDYLLLKLTVLRIEQLYSEKKNRYNAALVLQRAWRSVAWLIKLRRKLADIIKIQSVWRGSQIRADSNPRLRIIRKRLAKTTEKGIKPADTLRGKTQKCLGLVKTKAGLSRAVPQLESFARVSRECARMLAADEAALAAIVAFADTAAPSVLKSPASITTRSVLSAVNTLHSVATFPDTLSLIAARITLKPAKDVFSTLLLLMQALKTASSNTIPYDIVVAAMRALRLFLAHDETRRKLKQRKKWSKEVAVVLGEIAGMGKRRGAKEEGPRRELVEALVEALGQ